MATDMFLKLDGINGESTDSKHKDWIEVLSFGSGLTQAATGVSATGGLSGERADFHEVTATKLVDKASTELFIHCAEGKHIAKIELECCLATGEKHTFLKYTLEDCLITSLQLSGARGGDVKPMESVGIAYSKIKLEYTPIDHAGKPGTTLDRTWNLAENEKG